MKQHYVVFLSPGTVVAEQSKRSIDSWDIEKAIKMSYSIKERHAAIPYMFYFVTRGRKDDELDGHEIERSNKYYLGGTVLTLDEIVARDDPEDNILIDNMRNNNWDRVIENCNSWKWTQPFHEDDVILNYNPETMQAKVEISQ